VLDVTTKQCSQIQHNLIDLRTSTKQELDKLHGHLKLTLFDSMDTILNKAITPSAEFPTITRDMAPDKVLSIMNSRINSLESQMKIQLVTNQMLKSSLTEDTKIQDRYDELSSKIVQLERVIDTEKRRIGKIDKQVSHLQNVQSNVDRSLRLIDQKIALLTSAHFSGISSHQYAMLPTGTSSSSTQPNDSQRSILELLQTPLPDLNGPSEGGAGGGHRSTVKDSAKIQTMKSFLRDKRLSTRVDSSSSSPPPPSHGPGPLYSQLSSLHDFGDGDDGAGVSSVDSQGLLDEYVLERIDNLDTIINETILTKMQQTEKLSRQMTHELKTVQDTVKELEVLSSDFTSKGGPQNSSSSSSSSSLLDYDYHQLQERMMKSLSYDLKEQWEKVYEEVDKKLLKIDLILKQSETTLIHTGTSTHDTKGNLSLLAGVGGGAGGGGGSGYDDITKKLFSFKNKIRSFFESFTQCMEYVNHATSTSPAGHTMEHSNHGGHGNHSGRDGGHNHTTHSHNNKELILSSLTSILKDLLHDSSDILKTEIMIKDLLQNKLPGHPSYPVSYILTKLPDLLKITQKKTIEFLNKGINKLDLLTSIQSLQDLVTTLVPTHLFQQNNEDLKIALTLKADQKSVDLLSLKKASLVDLQKFREYVNDEIDSMRETLVKNASNSMKMLSSLTATAGGAGGGGGGGGGDHELNERFQIIISQFHELKKSMAGYVPRPEIESALQAILDEIRSVKRGSVDKEIFSEKLKMKADREEIERLLNLLAGTIGSPLNEGTTALAMRLKCLSCDKPINPFLHHSVPSPSHLQRPVTPGAHPEERERDAISDSPKARPSTTSAAYRGGMGGSLLTSKSISQLPPVGSHPSTATVPTPPHPLSSLPLPLLLLF
jgi:hypothetical protein